VDPVLPPDKTAKRLPGLFKDIQLTVVEGGPHAIPWTHAGQVNTALLDFLRHWHPAPPPRPGPPKQTTPMTGHFTVSSLPATTGARTTDVFVRVHLTTLTRSC
jgi:hypothetical protein